jgi:dipeptidyl aminopeptidase/acylaminoacyl peptidase
MPADGTAASLELLLATERSEYFGLTYWSEGLRVKGYMGRPRAGSSLPAVVFNRGGNREFGALEGWEIVPFVEAGFVAVASQYRGNAGGEGAEELGGADVADVLALLPLLARQHQVDPGRVGMVGYSRGGMMTYLALARGSRDGEGRVRAAVTVGGLADLEDALRFRPELASVWGPLLGGGQEISPAALRARSAVCWPERIDVPLLLLHGEADDRIPVEQSRRLAALLAAAGKPVRLETFPGEDHSLSSHSYGLPEVLDWLGQHLGRPGDDHSYERHREAIAHTMERWPR